MHQEKEKQDSIEIEFNRRPSVVSTGVSAEKSLQGQTKTSTPVLRPQDSIYLERCVCCYLPQFGSSYHHLPLRPTRHA